MTKLFLGLLIGLILGLWAGVNLGKGQEIWANPFKDDSLQARLQRDGQRMIDQGSDALKKAID